MTPSFSAFGRLVASLLLLSSWSALPGKETAPTSARIPPELIHAVTPTYPYSMRVAGLEGVVTLDFVIDTQGVPRNVYVVESNNPWLERPAIDAVLKWRFKPGRVEGRPVNTRARQAITFQLWGGGDIPWQITKSKDPSKLPPEFRWDDPPEPVAASYPVYPLDLLRTKTKGKVSLLFAVDARGEVTSAKVIESSAPELGQATLAMIDTWRFKPARKKGGEPCNALLHLEYEFKPRGDGDVPVPEGARRVLDRLEDHPERIVSMRDVDAPPVPLSRRPPVYPTALREKGATGQALIEFFIDESGDAQLPRIISATAPEFGYAAVQAIATWRFEPLRHQGKPVIVKVQIPMTFALQEPKQDTPASPVGKGGAP
jgi:TonB family protein